jgi:hypothetical protein
MNKKQLGQAAYEIIAAQVKDQGGSLTPEGMPKDYPISLRQIKNIKTGHLFNVSILAKVGIQVEVDYKIVNNG